MGVLIASLVGIVVVGLLIASFFVRRYRETDRPNADWHSTSEVFNDPSTNRLMRVWVDGGGGRHYVPESKQR